MTSNFSMNQSVLAADCLIVAAGLSSRMGTWKMMLAYQGGVLLDAAVRHGLAACQHVVVVAGYRGDEIEARYRGWQNVTVLFNLDYAQGMFRSIQVGTSALTHPYFFISLGDMPYLNPDLYHALWPYRSHETVFPGEPMRTGHPVLLSQRWIRKIQSAKPEQSMRTLIEASGQAFYLGLSDTRHLADIDTPADYQRLLLDEDRVKHFQARQ